MAPAGDTMATIATALAIAHAAKPKEFRDVRANIVDSSNADGARRIARSIEDMSTVGRSCREVLIVRRQKNDFSTKLARSNDDLSRWNRSWSG
jgi:hypothetical protein